MQRHLAILREPYLTYILQGKKTIESRWYVQKRSPFNKVFPNDELYLKRSSEMLRGYAEIKEAQSYVLHTSKEALDLAETYKKELCIGEDWLKHIEQAKCATLIWLKNVSRFDPPLEFRKNNGLPWVILKKGSFLYEKLEEVLKYAKKIKCAC